MNKGDIEAFDSKTRTMADRLYGDLRPSCPNEKQEHLAFMDWVRLNPRVSQCLIHIANEYDGGIRRGYQRKLMGVKSGVSDFLLVIPSRGYHGLFLELKRLSGGRVTETQKSWLTLVQSLGYAGEVCYGCSDAISKVEAYLTQDATIQASTPCKIIEHP